MKKILFFAFIIVFVISWIVVILNTFKNISPVKENRNKWLQFKVEQWFLLFIFPSIYIVWFTIPKIKLLNFDYYEDNMKFLLYVLSFCLCSAIFVLGLRAFIGLRKSK